MSLLSVGINTIQELLDKSASELLRIRNLGKKSLEEIKTHLAAYELKLKNDLLSEI